MTRSPRPGPGGKLALFEVLGGAGSGEPQATPSAAPRVVSSAAPLSQLLRVSTDNGRLSISTAPVAAIAVAAVMAFAFVGAFVLGRATASGQASAEPAPGQAAIMPEVLDLSTPGADMAAVPPQASLAETTPRTRLVSQPTPIETPTPVAPAGRLKGRNYLLVQSYHPSERDGAEATVEALRLAGIGATVETGVRGWGSFLCVVGTDPFTRRTGNPELDAYKRRIEAIGREVAGKRGVKRFDPQLVRWGR